MISRLFKTTILAGLFVGQTALTRADDLVPPGRNGASSLAPIGSPGAWQNSGSLGPQTAQAWGAGSTSQNLVQAQQGQRLPGIYSEPRSTGAQPPQPTAPAISGVARLPMGQPATTIGGSLVQQARFAGPVGNGVTRLPATGPVTSGGAAAAVADPGQTVDGTWREDGHYVIININGKETKLLKPATELNQRVVASQPSEEGTVRGRLLQGQRPLANCHVVMMPIREEGRKTYVYDETREPQTSTTNSDGDYFFEHVPAGQYKLTWLPQGTKQWIRRLVIKPDVVVHGGQEVSVKEIRFARATIN